MKRKEIMMISIFVLILVFLWWIPTGEKVSGLNESSGAKVRILSVDNQAIYKIGLTYQGEQRCEVEILNGNKQGEVVSGVNYLTGKLEVDKLFNVGDKAWALIEQDSAGTILMLNLIDYYRMDQQLVLIGIFIFLLILVSGFNGLRTLLSFALALLSIVKLLIPALLNGWNPLIVALVIGNFLTILTLLLVAGCNQKAYTAIASSMICSLITCLTSAVFAHFFHIEGTVMEWSEALLYLGNERLNLNLIFQSGIYLSCSGAILDLAIDVSSALDEIIYHHPTITRRSLIKSGFIIGKSVIGSQMTTLLLAYMGSYLSVFMVYMAQETPLFTILNSAKISSEILNTLIGCIGLVLVSPLTSFICGMVYCSNLKN